MKPNLSTAPAELRPLLEKCLEKDPRKRLRDISGVDALLELGRVKSAPQPEAQATSEALPTKARFLPWAVAAALLVIAATVAILHFGETPTTQADPVRFAMPFPPSLRMPPGLVDIFKGFALSPDGRFVVFTAANEAGETSLWLRRLDSYFAQNLDRTNGASMPFWSPNSQEIAFFSDGELKRMPLAGGAPVTICSAPDPFGGSWNEAGQILFSSNQTVQLVSAAGGSPSPVTTLDSGERALVPVFLPDGDHFLYSRLAPSGPGGGYVQALTSPEPILVTPDAVGGFAAPNHLILVRNGTAMVQDLDMTTFASLGDPRVLDSDVSTIPGLVAGLSVSANGAAVFRPAAGGVELSVYQRDGRRSQLDAAARDLTTVALSPDGKRLVVTRGELGIATDLWLLELASGVFSRLTSDEGAEVDPTWAPDSQRILFASRTPGKNEIREITVGSSSQKVIYSNPDGWALDDVSSDGKWIIFRGSDFRTRLLAYGEQEPQLVNEVGAGIDQTHISPDGRWVAYNSTESGNTEVYVAAFPSFQQKRQISVGGGAQPQWRRDGRELYYLAPDSRLMAVDIQSSATLETGPARALFQTNINFQGQINTFVPSPDGQQFYVAEAGAEGRPELRVVMNSPALLE